MKPTAKIKIDENTYLHVWVVYNDTRSAQCVDIMVEDKYKYSKFNFVTTEQGGPIQHSAGKIISILMDNSEKEKKQ